MAEANAGQIELGPQNPKDPPFTARMRLHQSWYRAEILRVPYGTGPKPTNKTPLGSMLTQADGDRGLNFLSPHIFQVARRRLAERRGVLDSFRVLCNLLSGDALSINLFGLLVDDLELAQAWLGALLPGRVRSIKRIFLEWAPQPPGDYLNDPTTFNLLVAYSNPAGKVGFIAAETRLTDPAPPKSFPGPIYRRWTKQLDSPWPEAFWPRLVESSLFPLWRSHLLSFALRENSPYNYVEGTLLYLYHPGDEAARQSIAAYQSLLKPEDDSFLPLPLDRLLEVWRAGLPDRPALRHWLEDFDLRYLDLSRSAPAA